MLNQVGGAYEAIRPEAAARYLGLDVQGNDDHAALIEKFTSCGWTWDCKLLHPKQAEIETPVDRRPLSTLSDVMALVGR